MRDALGLEEGAPYSSTDDRGRRASAGRLSACSRSVEIREDCSAQRAASCRSRSAFRRATCARYASAAARALDVLRLSFHLRAGWENRNFLGRHAQPDARGAARRHAVSDQHRPTGGARAAAARVSPADASCASRRSWKVARPGFIDGQYARLSRAVPAARETPLPEEEAILGYHEVKAATGVERQFFLHRLFLRPSYNWQANFPILLSGQSRRRHRRTRSTCASRFPSCSRGST